MKTYKRGIGGLIMGLLSAPAAAFFLLVVLRNFLSPFLTIVLSIIAFILILYLTIFSENIKFIVNDEKKILTYYKNRKIVKDYNLKNANLSYNMKLGKHSSVIDLKIDDDIIDCEPLGANQFLKMYEHLQKLADIKPIKINVGE